MKSNITRVKTISIEERRWLHSLNNAFDSMHLAYDQHGGKLDVLMLAQKHEDPQYNPHRSLKYYIASVTTLNGRTFYEAVATPTGLVVLDQGMQMIKCIDGFLHDASGSPAMTSTLFGDAYYLDGVNYTPIEYFRYLEKEKGRYPEYQPQKFVEYMANVLGGKD